MVAGGVDAGAIASASRCRGEIGEPRSHRRARPRASPRDDDERRAVVGEPLGEVPRRALCDRLRARRDDVAVVRRPSAWCALTRSAAGTPKSARVTPLPTAECPSPASRSPSARAVARPGGDHLGHHRRGHEALVAGHLRGPDPRRRDAPVAVHRPCDARPARTLGCPAAGDTQRITSPGASLDRPRYRSRPRARSQRPAASDLRDHQRTPHRQHDLDERRIRGRRGRPGVGASGSPPARLRGSAGAHDRSHARRARARGSRLQQAVRAAKQLIGGASTRVREAALCRGLVDPQELVVLLVRSDRDALPS